ncbi:MAG: hypothetical protein AAF998_03605 [Bacteroidota bacterium]
MGEKIAEEGRKKMPHQNRRIKFKPPLSGRLAIFIFVEDLGELRRQNIGDQIFSSELIASSKTNICYPTTQQAAFSQFFARDAQD